VGSSVTPAVILRTDNLTKRFGGLVAVDSVSFEVRRGTVKGIIGPNGAGKTTLVNLISGLDRPSSGKIYCDGIHVTNWPPQRRVMHCGIARTFQSARLFGTLTVLENLLVAAHGHYELGFLGSFLQPPLGRDEQREIVNRAMEMLDFVGLRHRSHSRADALPHGERRLLELARALMTKPKVLLLDEPAAGLNQSEVIVLAGLIAQLRQAGITVVLVEHHMRLVMEVCDKVLVLNFGRILAEGTPEEVQENDSVRHVYLGAKVQGE
jgi:ABC-type branched-subunit amino acid transport system ATPase component